MGHGIYIGQMCFLVLQQMQKKELQREIESAVEGMRDQLVKAVAAVAKQDN